MRLMYKNPTNQEALLFMMDIRFRYEHRKYERFRMRILYDYSKEIQDGG